MLVDIKSLTVEAANSGAISSEEIKANQLQIDSAVQSITRISNVTNFAGLNLLDGSMDYNLSGVVASQLNSVRIYNAQFASATSIPVNVSVLTSAQPAELRWPQSSVSSAVSIQVAGVNGVETIQFASATSVAKVLAAINGVKGATGVSAAYIVSAGSAEAGLKFFSTEWGSDAFVSVERIGTTGTFSTEDVGGVTKDRVAGRDIAATINGAFTQGKGLTISLNTTYLSMDLTTDAALGSTATSFVITGGGALFQLGPHVSINEQRSFGIQSVAASNLGNSATGYLSQIVTGGGPYTLDTDPDQAAVILDEAISQISALRGRLGAFEKNTLQTNINSLEVSLENVMASESTIRDADFAAETAALTRGQILTSAATSVLAVANSSPQSVLQLLQ